MQAQAIHFINDLLDWFNSAPVHQWYAFGVFLASVPVVIAIVQWVKKHHFNKKAVELENHFIAINLLVWSGIATTADFVLVNGPHFATYLPYLHDNWGWIATTASSVYALSKAANNWFINRQGETQKQRTSAVIQSAEQALSGNTVNIQAAATRTTAETSFGTVSATVDKSKLVM